MKISENPYTIFFLNLTKEFCGLFFELVVFHFQKMVPKLFPRRGLLLSVIFSIQNYIVMPNKSISTIILQKSIFDPVFCSKTRLWFEWIGLLVCQTIFWRYTQIYPQNFFLKLKKKFVTDFVKNVSFASQKRSESSYHYVKRS